MRLRRKAFFGSPVFSVGISVFGTEYNVNARSRAIAAGWNQIDPLMVLVSVGGSGLIGSASPAMAALMFAGTFPIGSMASVVIQPGGRIVGAGGSGGNGWSDSSLSPATSGGAGGPAIQTRISLSVRNNGVVAGGGGGGGGGGAFNYLSNRRVGGSAGGGGAGVNPGNFGFPGHPPLVEGVVSISGNHGAAGTFETGGAGGALRVDPASDIYGLSGGNGGALGQSGASGGNEPSTIPSAIGGVAGAYIDGASLTTWVITGTRLGRAIN